MATRQVRRDTRRPGSGYPCRVLPAGIGLHVWSPTAVDGWYVCVGCGVAGVCSRCFAAASWPLPRGPVPMRCAVHQSPLGAEEQVTHGGEQEGVHHGPHGLR